MQNKERHFCFVYFGNRLHIPDFNELKFILVEGCCEPDGDRVVQYVKVSLHPNNGRRIGSIPKIIEQYNSMEGRSEKVTPLIYFPDYQVSSTICFKTTTQDNPILNHIAEAQRKKNKSFWRWVSPQGKGKSQIPSDRPVSSSKRHQITTVQDIAVEMRLPESVVSVQRLYDELSEPYFREYKVPLGEGTGCIPLEHSGFIVSEIKRLFEEELSYIEQPSIAPGGLPLYARALVDNAGWMGDILLSGEGMEVVTGGKAISTVRAENALVRKCYVSTGKKKSDRLERRGVGNSIREFLVFYAIKWNSDGSDSVCKSIKELHAGWTPPLEPLIAFQGLIAGISLRPCVVVEDQLLRIVSVEKLVGLLCSEGLITKSSASTSQPLGRMTVQVECNPVPSILNYFKTMLKTEWDGVETVEVTAAEVVRGLNGGDVGVYRRSCVSQFMRPFLFDGSVEGYFWKETGGIHCEKYVVHVKRVMLRLDQPVS
jgi:hypothetical protein